MRNRLGREKEMRQTDIIEQRENRPKQTPTDRHMETAPTHARTQTQTHTHNTHSYKHEKPKA